MMAEEKNGRTILTVAVCSGSLVIFAEVLDALGRLFSREEVRKADGVFLPQLLEVVLVVG